MSKIKKSSLFLLVLLCGTLLFACSNTPIAPPEPSNTSGQLIAHYLDVGQADAIFIELPNSECMLIDAGNNKDNQTVINYIQQQGYQKINYLVGTHPHEDHIGAMDDVIKTFAIGKIYLPKVTNNTQTFAHVLTAIEEKNLTINTAQAGVNILQADQLNIQIIAPLAHEYDTLNNYSAVIKITFGNTSFLFTGDAETASEQEMLTQNLHADVLKVGHHGSSTSTSTAFLEKVAPKHAVISVGKNNDYGHPDGEIITKLQQANIPTYRTDLQGTIIITSDGNNITVNTKQAANSNTANQVPPTVSQPDNVTDKAATTTDNNTRQYIGNKNSKKVHLPTCNALPTEKNRVYFKTLAEAIQQNYTPCSNCQPQ